MATSVDHTANRRIQASVKDVYLYPLIPDFRRELFA